MKFKLEIIPAISPRIVRKMTDVLETAGLLHAVSEERDKLKELEIWMTGCGYDFCQHDHFCKKRDELLKT